MTGADLSQANKASIATRPLPAMLIELDIGGDSGARKGHGGHVLTAPAGLRTLARCPSMSGGAEDAVGEPDVDPAHDATLAAGAAAPAAASDPAPHPTGLGATVGTGAPSAAARTGLTTVTSPKEALALEEVNRTRIFLRFAIAICASVVISLSFLTGHHGVKLALYGAVGVCACLVLWLHFLFRDPARYTERKVVFVALWCAITTMLGVVYWGIFSPAPTLIVLGIYFFSRTSSLGATLLVYGTCALVQAVMAVLIITGAIADPGLFPATEVTLDMAVSQGMVQLVYLFSFWLARATRGVTLDALGRLEAAVRQGARREALLQEARQDLDRALRIGGPGRYTEQVLAGYRLGNVIGRGAMGEVYEAMHAKTGEPAAVKLLQPAVLDSRDQVERFLREARIAGAFASEHVVRILAASDPSDPLPFLVMERLEGEDLAAYLRRVQRMPADQLAELVAHVGQVLDEARGHAIVHRDLKPHNVFRAQRGDGVAWKVLDFGVSKLGDNTGTLTRGQLIGTPAYMAPEQARGWDVDHRADLYALAAIAYRAITGQPPFSGGDVSAILYNVVHELAPAASTLTKVPPAVDHVMVIGLAKRADDRFATAAELGAALATAMRGEHDPDLAARARRVLERRRAAG